MKIDIDSVKSGQELDKIKPSYLIFLMPFDLFGRGSKTYVLEQWFDPSHHVSLETESQLIILNSRGSIGHVPAELQNFFNLMNGQHDTTTQFGKRIVKDTQTVKQDPEKERDFMDMALKMYDARKEGEMKGKN